MVHLVKSGPQRNVLRAMGLRMVRFDDENEHEYHAERANMDPALETKARRIDSNNGAEHRAGVNARPYERRVAGARYGLFARGNR